LKHKIYKDIGIKMDPEKKLRYIAPEIVYIDPSLLSHGEDGESNDYAVPPGEENPGDMWD